MQPCFVWNFQDFYDAVSHTEIPKILYSYVFAASSSGVILEKYQKFLVTTKLAKVECNPML